MNRRRIRALKRGWAEVDWYRLAIGVFGIGYGGYHLVAWALKRQTSRSAVRMITQYGEERGRRVHGMTYGLLPFAIGVVLLVFTL